MSWAQLRVLDLPISAAKPKSRSRLATTSLDHDMPINVISSIAIVFLRIRGEFCNTTLTMHTRRS
jgi:hypothetical protein